jgi:hypothetical protein
MPFGLLVVVVSALATDSQGFFQLTVEIPPVGPNKYAVEILLNLSPHTNGYILIISRLSCNFSCYTLSALLDVIVTRLATCLQKEFGPARQKRLLLLSLEED